MFQTIICHVRPDDDSVLQETCEQLTHTHTHTHTQIRASTILGCGSLRKDKLEIS